MLIDDKKRYKVFFGNGANYYLDKLEKYNTGNKISFNISAFFLSVLWFLYRKMYIQSFVIILLFFLFDYVINNIFNIDSNIIFYIDLFVTVLIALLSGFLSNIVYLKHSKRIVEKISNDLVLKKKGGTNLIPPIILIALYSLFVAFY